MKLFYKEAKQLAEKTINEELDLTVITVKKENKANHDLNIVRIQLALWKSFQEGYRKGLLEGKGIHTDSKNEDDN